MSTNIPEGHGIIAGRSRATAQSALDAAVAAGVDSAVVKAVPEGYLVPDAVLDAWHEINQESPAETPAEPEAEPEAELEAAPTSDWKNADIEAWAEAHGVDLDGATKKADMLEAIASATGKE